MKPGDLARFRLGRSGSCYPGGKGSVYQKLINLIPPHEVYVEPFLGAGSVMLHKRPTSLNIGIDIDADVIAAWQSAAATPEAATSAGVPATGVIRRRPSRSLATPDLTTPPDASPFLATSPAATLKRASVNCADPASIAGVARSLDAGSSATRRGDAARFEFLCADALGWLRRYCFNRRAFLYCDPPYLHETRRRTDLYAHEMSQGQHVELLRILDQLPCMVMVSGYPSGLYSLALRNWNTLQYPAMTRRGLATEQVWFNYSTPTELHDYRYLGDDRRERYRIRRKCKRWTAKLAGMDRLERQALLAAIETAQIKKSEGVLPQ
jgi:DNA adenine methylase